MAPDSVESRKRKVWSIVGSLLGFVLLMLGAFFILEQRRNPSASSRLTLAAILGGIATVLWTSQNLSPKAGRELDRVIIGIAPAFTAAATAAAGVSALLALGVVYWSLTPRFLALLESTGSLWKLVSLGLLSQLLAGLLLGAIVAVLTANLRCPAGSSFRERAKTWVEHWPVASFFALIALSQDVGLTALAALIVAGVTGITVYGVALLTRWIISSPVRLGFLVQEAAASPSPALGLVWVLSVVALSMLVWETILEY